jgi:hypothetical protein
MSKMSAVYRTRNPEEGLSDKQGGDSRILLIALVLAIVLGLMKLGPAQPNGTLQSPFEVPTIYAASP